ncbi:MAG: class I SAM-dependent methyltransferase [Limnochordaceae bacterium]|uniref:Class I SAM-dependent methyltransferase n=1 Tax=Carboxydichorda subterranea TaxID=3109565 RepID=A0ABZ1BV16_9FIRM|nr:class I SAM-dependent methyltransferase [Limnochorda sp. L945t]MBE3599177.1 class I SAM-dependent methyltransferase [Limnochordaceae bacterium]WRP16647.1 class I SAM-dependent methyltransferase [Limnochorda sp. L945t]
MPIDWSYYTDRPDVRGLVRDSCRTILDLGCGPGLVGEALKRSRPCRVTGVEINREAAEEARRRIDEVIAGDIEQLVDALPARAYDCILAADVLEHLRDPWRVLRALRRCLAHGGYVVASVPNVAHWCVLKGLLEGDWVYQPQGLLDATHLRFFTRRGIVRLFESSGYRIQQMAPMVSPICGEVPAVILEGLRSAGFDADRVRDEATHWVYYVVAYPVADGEGS